ncbi:hypothetical protein BDQ12DRAFT_713642 [Crucibulum laeve]|uniref:Uncharacterized protein n=1 Tax=Crucibulum laeve TaxID=68775 RepID=A0A5C3LWB0_9AGAR|nr:hypothetical protein BDQ12DRAFT_713642 [Crucibulum laeve]
MSASHVTDSAATATFTFTGSAVYYMAPLLRIKDYNGFTKITTLLTLDSRPAETVNLMSPSVSGYKMSDVRWSATDLANVTHTLVVSINAPGQIPATLAVVDAFIYTVDEGDVPVSSSNQASVLVNTQSSSIPNSLPTTSILTAGETIHSSTGASALIGKIIPSSATQSEALKPSASDTSLGAEPTDTVQSSTKVDALNSHPTRTSAIAAGTTAALFSVWHLSFQSTTDHIYSGEVPASHGCMRDLVIISLFLTSNPGKLCDSSENDRTHISVWKVIRLGGGLNEFDLTVPCVSGAGFVEVGFATVDDTSGCIKSDTVGPSHASLDDNNVWETEPLQEDEKLPSILENAKRGAKFKLNAKNRSSTDARIALLSALGAGIRDGEATEQYPFMLIEADLFRSRTGEYKTSVDLYLHMFRSVDYSSGKYGKNLVQRLINAGERITEENGLTTWRVETNRDGRLRLVSVKNEKKKIKQFHHEFKVDKNVRESPKMSKTGYGKLKFRQSKATNSEGYAKLEQDNAV